MSYVLSLNSKPFPKNNPNVSFMLIDHWEIRSSEKVDALDEIISKVDMAVSFSATKRGRSAGDFS